MDQYKTGGKQTTTTTTPPPLQPHPSTSSCGKGGEGKAQSPPAFGGVLPVPVTRKVRLSQAVSERGEVVGGLRPPPTPIPTLSPLSTPPSAADYSGRAARTARTETLYLALSVVSLSVQGCPFLDHSKTVREGWGWAGVGTQLLDIQGRFAIAFRFEDQCRR